MDDRSCSVWDVGIHINCTRRLLDIDPQWTEGGLVTFGRRQNHVRGGKKSLERVEAAVGSGRGSGSVVGSEEPW